MSAAAQRARRLGRPLLAALVCALALAGLARAESVQSGKVRVGFEGEISPHVLPRHGVAPVAVRVGGSVSTVDGSAPPQLRRFEIAFNNGGKLDYTGLPRCPLRLIQPSTTENALRACGQAKVGEGTLTAKVAIPEQSPFPSDGKIVAFNGREGGRPVIFAHVYGTEPIPTSYTLPFRIGHTKGTFGTTLAATLPTVTSRAAYITGIALTLDRRYRYRGETHSYLSAGCPAPQGFPGALFPLAKASFVFTRGRTLTSVLTRNCRARG